MAGKKKLDTYGADRLKNYAERKEGSEVPKKSNVSQNSINNLHERRDGRSPAKYMQVNVYGYEDYLYRMARYNKKTTTKYILSLIEKDAKEHAKEYESLRQLPEFDKPYRESPNKKKKEVITE